MNELVKAINEYNEGNSLKLFGLYINRWNEMEVHVDGAPLDWDYEDRQIDERVKLKQVVNGVTFWDLKKKADVLAAHKEA